MPNYNEQLEIFPNPVFDQFQIRTKNQDDKKELYNVAGQLLLTTRKNEINLSNYSKGVYYLKCGNTVRKVVKE